MKSNLFSGDGGVVSIVPLIPAPKKLISSAIALKEAVAAIVCALKEISGCMSLVPVLLYNGWVKWIAVKELPVLNILSLA